ncbi:MAG: cupredoxin domain-containing protein [Actinomycetota bacterium]
MAGQTRTKRAKAIVALAVAAGLTLGTFGVADAVTVGVRGIFNGTRFVWSPTVRTITPGTIVRWRAVDGSHNVRSRGSNWSYFRNLPLGTSVARTFNRRGTFRYYCTIHGGVVNGVCTGMCGRIVVS